MNICKVCGFANESGATFCGSCGTFLEWNSEPADPSTQPKSGDAQPPPPGNPGTGPGGATTIVDPVPVPVPPDPGLGGTGTTPVPPGKVRCAVCGLDNEPTRILCGRCGAELAPTKTITTVIPEPPKPPTIPPRAVIAVGAVLVLVLGAAAFLLFGRNAGIDGQPTSSPGSASASGASPSAAQSTGPTNESQSPDVSLDTPTVLEGEIAYAVKKGDNSAVWIWDAANGKSRRLVGGTGMHQDPSWPKDRSAVVYQTTNESCKTGKSCGLTIANADKSKRTNGDFTHHEADQSPAWSPDGTVIAFASTFTHKQGDPNGSLDLYTRKVDDDPGNDDEDTTRLTTGKAEEWDPAWDSDGSRLVYVSRAANGSSRLMLLPADGSGDPTRIGLGSGEFDDPTFSADGEWIAYTRRDNAGEPKDVWIAHPDGTAKRQITTTKASEADPTWSPDGKFLAVVQGEKIVIVSVATGDTVAQIVPDGNAMQPEWR